MFTLLLISEFMGISAQSSALIDSDVTRIFLDNTTTQVTYNRVKINDDN